MMSPEVKFDWTMAAVFAFLVVLLVFQIFRSLNFDRYLEHIAFVNNKSDWSRGSFLFCSMVRLDLSNIRRI